MYGPQNVKFALQGLSFICCIEHDSLYLPDFPW